MSYTIYHADGTPVGIPDAIIDTEYYNPTGGNTNNGLGIQFIGDRAVAFGAAIAQNFLQMTENFASATAPSDATSLQGQLWFNKISPTSGNLYVRTQQNTSGGILNWNKLVTEDTSGNLSIAGTINATHFTGDGSLLTGINIGVASITAGTGISITPSGGTGNVTISTGGVAAGVSSFNTRTGGVTLTSTDVNTALGFTAGTVSSVTVAGTTGRIISTGGPITSSGTVTLDLATTGITPGTYPAANITVDAYGRLTSAYANNNIAFAPTALASVGQFVYVNNGMLPAGGTWAYYNICTADDGNVTQVHGFGGIAAGGSAISDAPGTGGYGGGDGHNIGWAWRIA